MAFGTCRAEEPLLDGDGRVRLCLRCRGGQRREGGKKNGGAKWRERARDARRLGRKGGMWGLMKRFIATL